jgi:cysteinyl-tRNA synthetase
VIEATALEAKWDESMADDMNTAAALGHVFVLMKIVNRILEDKTQEVRTGPRHDPPRPQAL